MADKKEPADFFDWEGQVKHHLKEINGMKIPQENKDLILRFEERSQTNIKSSLNYIVTLKKFLEYVPKKPFKEFERDDFNRWVKELNTKYRPNTMNNYMAVVKRFFRFVFDLEDDETPVCMKGIKKKKIDRGEQETRLRKSILTKEEILRMIQAIPNRKHRAMCAVIFDGCLRKSELIKMKIGELEDCGDYIDVTVRGKGNRVDVVTLIDSVPYLRDWLNVHPFREDPEAPLWLKERNEGKPLQAKEWLIDWLLKELARRAGINKRIWVHLTRHSKCSSMHAEGYSLPEIAQHARHRSLSSTLIYSHVGNDQLKRKMLMKNGKLPPQANRENPMRAIICERCQEENQPTNKFCKRCGWEFGKDLKKVQKEKFARSFMNFAIEDKEFDQVMEKVMERFVREQTNLK